MTLDDPQARRRARILVVATALAGLAICIAIVLTAMIWLRPGTAAPQSKPTSGTQSTRLSWSPVGGVALPFSAMDGPHVPATGRKFSDTPNGAALAAVHLLIRTSATSGPPVFGPTLVDQVTGANADAMRTAVPRQYEQLQAAGDVPDGDAQVLGFRHLTCQPGSASAEVVLSSPGLAPTGEVVGFQVQLQWLDDDWRLVAPPNGDWGTAATTYDTPPADLTDYRDLR